MAHNLMRLLWTVRPIVRYTIWNSQGYGLGKNYRIWRRPMHDASGREIGLPGDSPFHRSRSIWLWPTTQGQLPPKVRPPHWRLRQKDGGARTGARVRASGPGMVTYYRTPGRIVFCGIRPLEHRRSWSDSTKVHSRRVQPCAGLLVVKTKERYSVDLGSALEPHLPEDPEVCRHCGKRARR